jgi:hypothetical protein
MIYKLVLLSTLISASVQAEVKISVDSLYIVNSENQSNIQKEYRIEIFNNTDTDCLFFISPDTSKEKNVAQKFKSFLKQDVGDGWRMIHIIYETGMIYDPKYYSEKNLLKIICARNKFIVYILTDRNIDEILSKMSTIRMKEVDFILRTGLRKDLIYPYPEVVFRY